MTQRKRLGLFIGHMQMTRLKQREVEIKIKINDNSHNKSFPRLLYIEQIMFIWKAMSIYKELIKA